MQQFFFLLLRFHASRFLPIRGSPLGQAAQTQQRHMCEITKTYDVISDSNHTFNIAPNLLASDAMAAAPHSMMLQCF
jgi:hypothetical protein